MDNGVASVEVSAEQDLAAIAAAAGNGDVDGRWYAGGRLHVVGVTQAALDAAAVLTNHAPAVPASVTNFQARALMRRTILPDGRSLETTVREALAAGKAAAASLPEADPIRIAADEAWLAWEQSNEFTRRGALVTAIAAQLGYADAEIDDLFRAASQIEA
jgi:hypothetical protein